MTIRGPVGLILGIVVGLLLVRLLSATLIEKGHVLSGSLEIVIVVVVALVGLAAGESTGAGTGSD